jgi:hypothetical protein
MIHIILYSKRYTGLNSIFLLIRNTQKKQEAQRYQKGCCLFKSSFLKPLSQLELDLVGMFFGCSSKKFMFFWLVESTQMKQEIQRCQKGCCQYTVQTCIPFTIENYMNHQLLQIRDMTHGCLINRQHPFWYLWASCFFCVFLINKKKTILTV